MSGRVDTFPMGNIYRSGCGPILSQGVRSTDVSFQLDSDPWSCLVQHSTQCSMHDMKSTHMHDMKSTHGEDRLAVGGGRTDGQKQSSHHQMVL